MVGDGWHSSNQSLIVCQLVTTGIFVRLSQVLPVPCFPPLKAAPASRVFDSFFVLFSFDDKLT